MPKRDNSFKNLLYKYMYRNGINNATLACRIEVCRPTIGNWKNGTIPNHDNHEKVRKCADVLLLKGPERREFLRAAKVEDINIIQRKIVPITGPVTHPSQFFGREAILARIFNSWQQLPLEHVAIIGSKSSGKTSLLNYLKSVHNCNDLRDGQRCDWIKQEYNWILVDFENLQLHSPENFMRYLLKELKLNYGDTNELLDLTEIFNENLKQPTIILLDNIRNGLKSPELNERFWQYIRFLGNEPNLSFCITSSSSLADLNQWAVRIGKPSPTENIFSGIKLGPLTEMEARELLSYVSLAQADLEWILETSQCWPALLQMLCKTRECNENWQEIGLKNIKHYELSK